MKQSIGVIALLLASTQAISLNQMNTNLQGEKNKPGDSSNVDIDPESFAEASTNARIETDLEIAEGKSTQNQNELWKKHFQASEFYKNYQDHLQHRGEMTHIRNLNNQALTQIKTDYKKLQGKYNNLSKQAKQNWDLGKKLAQQVPGGEQLFSEQQGPASYQNLLLEEVDDVEEAPKTNELETIENSTIHMDKDPSNPFVVNQKSDQQLSSLNIPEDIAPAEEKEKWFNEIPQAPKVVQEKYIPKEAEKEPKAIQIPNASQPVTDSYVSAPAQEPMASAILNVIQAPESNEMVRIGEKPEELPQSDAPQDNEDIQIKGLPEPETTQATVTNRNWSITVIKTVNPPITAPAGALKVSDWAQPIEDSPVVEPLEAAEMPVVEHEKIYDNFPNQPIKCSETN